MNGKQLHLVESQTQSEQSSKSMFWINDQEINVAGEAGRFFKELSTYEAAVELIRLKVRNKANQVFKTELKLNRTFLDGTFSKTIQVSEEQLGANDFKFKLSGRIPKSTQLMVENGKVIVNSDQNAEVDVSFPLGNSVLIAKLKQADLVERVMNTPIQVRKISHQPGEPSLALRVPEGIKSGDSWLLSKEPLQISGKTNPGANIFINGQEALVNSDGSFTFLFNPISSEEKIVFKIIIKEAPAFTYSKTILCLSCVPCLACNEKFLWYYPDYRISGEFYISGSVLGSSEYDTFNGLSNQISGFPSLGSGYQWNKRFSLGAYFAYFPGKQGIGPFEAGGKTLFFMVPALFYPVQVVCFGLAPAYEVIQGLNTYSRIVARWILGLRIGITKHFEFAPWVHHDFLNLIIFRPGGAKIGIVIEPLALRYYF